MNDFVSLSPPSTSKFLLPKEKIFFNISFKSNSLFLLILDFINFRPF